MKLRRLFEMAGMSENIDFDEQTTLSDGSRPDFVVRLPDSGVIPIDSKATGAHFLQAAELDPGDGTDGTAQKTRKGHAENRGTQSKRYQETIEGEFDHVVMFVPSEAMAAAAFSMDPDLMDYAMSKIGPHRNPSDHARLVADRRPLLATARTCRGANEIYEVSRELYKRVNTTVDHL